MACLSRHLSSGIADGGKGICLQGGAPDQEAIHITLVCQLSCVLVIDRAAYSAQMAFKSTHGHSRVACLHKLALRATANLACKFKGASTTLI